MGLLDFLSPGAETTDKRAEEVRSGAVAPLRTERAKCYLARDAYFACLDANGIVDALKDEKDAAKKCGAQGKDFERDCAEQWVTYFKKWRVQDIKKKQMLAELEAKGAAKMDVNTEFKSR
ncbi:cytochrome oxidase c subunit VIb-domain-containing protein [Coniochaeta sp. 2T2.1]|nr:cytochrome oxidase c subunit VIb-domain-containing protein [Coniochaeta sp. 2T2.1]